MENSDFPYGNYRLTKDNVDKEFWIAHIETQPNIKYRVLAWLGEDVTMQRVLYPWSAININGSFVVIEGDEGE